MDPVEQVLNFRKFKMALNFFQGMFLNFVKRCILTFLLLEIAVNKTDNSFRTYL